MVAAIHASLGVTLLLYLGVSVSGQAGPHSLGVGTKGAGGAGVDGGARRWCFLCACMEPASAQICILRFSKKRRASSGHRLCQGRVQRRGHSPHCISPTKHSAGPLLLPRSMSRYLAFGNDVGDDVLAVPSLGPPWLIALVNCLVLLHLAAVYQARPACGSPLPSCYHQWGGGEAHHAQRHLGAHACMGRHGKRTGV